MRYDHETQKIYITGISLKRKIRDRIALLKGNQPPNEIYFSSSHTVLNDHHRWAMEQANIDMGGSKTESGKKQMKISPTDRNEISNVLCCRFIDIRTFGAPLRASEYPGEIVRGPCQIPITQSLNTVMPTDVGITRGSVTNERDSDKECTMGQFSKVRHAAFLGICTISAQLSKSTGFSEEDLELLVNAIDYMFEEDRAYNRMLNLQGLIILKHKDPLRSGKLHTLKKAIEISQKQKYTETFDDFDVRLNDSMLPRGVSIERNDFSG